MVPTLSAVSFYVPTPQAAKALDTPQTSANPSQAQTETSSTAREQVATGASAVEATNSGEQAKNEQQEKQDESESDQLAQRDREVRAHEAAHQSAAGGLGGAVHFEYQTGPDGKRYAVGGEVPIDVSKIAGDPQATLIKASRIRNAALAPVDPSAHDRAVAAKAAALAAEAQKELLQESSQQAPKSFSNDDVASKTPASTHSDSKHRAETDQDVSPARVEHHAVKAYQALADEQAQALHLVA